MAHGRKLKISVTVDEEYMTKVDALAEAEERTRSQIVEFAIREYLNKAPRLPGDKRAKAATERGHEH